MKSLITLVFTLIITGSFAKDWSGTSLNVFNPPFEDTSLNGKVRISGFISNYDNKGTTVVALNSRKIAINDTGYFETTIIPRGYYSFKIKHPDKELIDLDSLQFLANHVYDGTFVLRSKNQSSDLPIMTYKPAIYFYPDSVEDVHARLYPMGKIDFSYPEYKDGWQVKAHPDGTLEQNGRSYDYLFWDGPLNVRFDEAKFNTGWIVSSDSLVTFFETTLSQMGLNESERNDFITYWVPKLKTNKRNLIHFLMNEDYDDIAHLKVYPKPQSSLRMMMLYFNPEGHDWNPKPQQFPEFKRDGFTVIEWGGAQANIILKPLPLKIPIIGNEVDKPVIYLYPEKRQSFELSFDFNGSLNFTHPQYKDGWKGTMNPNGNIEISGQRYDYLFWEGLKPDLQEEIDLTVGSLVKKDELEEFLQDALGQMSFNDREIQDFMCYWLPRMLHHEQTYIHFICNEAYDDKIAQMHISPTPDQMVRLFMVWNGVEKGQEMQLTKQSFKPVSRRGFTLVEWGGSEIEFVDIKRP